MSLSLQQVEKLAEEITLSLEDLMNSREYESPLVRSSDDVVLLSKGFKYSSLGSDVMYCTDKKGNEWEVVLSSEPAPVFYRNRSRVGTMTYDDMVSTFK